MPKCVPFQPIVCKFPLQTGGNDSNALSTHVKARTRPRRGSTWLFGGVSSALVFLCLPAASLSHSHPLPGHQGLLCPIHACSLVTKGSHQVPGASRSYLSFQVCVRSWGVSWQNAGVDPHGSLCAATWGKLISRSSRHGRQRITETEERAKNTD